MKARIIPKQDGYLEDGVTVKLNYDKIKSNSFYPKLTERYKNWVEENKDTVFLIWHNPKFANRPDLVGLIKDGQKQVWLFTYEDIEKVEVPMCTTCYEEPAIEGLTECKGCRESRLREENMPENIEELIEAINP